jgi:serine/threonine-protein kinase
MGENCNHAHFPTGGGLDFLSVGSSAEPGCLEFRTGRRTVQIMKPRSLTLERIDAAGNSFFLLELDDLDPSGVYETDENEPDQDNDAEAERRSEDLVEVAPADYVSRDVWDRGFLDHDENGHEIPIPDDARLAVRWLKGKVLLVANGSLWNGDPGTYDGRHNKMTADQIRQIIERSLAS